MMKCMAAATMTIVGVMAAVFPVLADSPVESNGNLVYEKDAVSLYAADFDYLYAEADNLRQEQGVTELPSFSKEDAGRKEKLASEGSSIMRTERLLWIPLILSVWLTG